MQHHLTVVLQASFTYTEEGEVELSDEPEPVRREAGLAPAPMAFGSSDLAPFLPRAEIWLTGYACAPGIREVESVTARLAVGRHAVLLDKAVHVYGDRPPGEGGAAPVPFKKMAIEYERAVGGLTNPAAPPNRPPNVIDPADPERPCGFGLLSRTWPQRRKRLGGHAPPDDAARLEVPAGFDWAYFQAAPEDQQCERLVGDEWVVLDGLHPMRPRVQLRLPGARAFAQVLAPGFAAQGHCIALSCDGLHIDSDRQRLTLRWRGAFAVVEPSRLGELCVEGAVSTDAELVDWAQLRAGDPAQSRTAGEVPLGSTRAQGAGEAARPDAAGSSAPALPGSARGTLAIGTGSTEVREQLGLPAPAASPSAAAGVGASQPGFRAWASRLAVSQTDAELLREVLGIAAPSEEKAAGPEPEPSSTASLSDDEAVALRQRLAIPFPLSQRPGGEPPLRLRPIPGAPWEQAPDASPPGALAEARPALAPAAPPPTVPGFRPAPGAAELLARNRAKPPAASRPAVGARTRMGLGANGEDDPS